MEYIKLFQSPAQPLTKKIMRQLSNNWANGSQAYVYNGKYYDQTGEPISQEQYNYYYDKNGKFKEPVSTQVNNETSNLIYNYPNKSTANTHSTGTQLQTFEDGSTRTVKYDIKNNQNGHNVKSSISVYDPNNLEYLNVKY